MSEAPEEHDKKIKTPEAAEKNFDTMVEAAEEIQNSYAEYALHVIKQRALPDVRDGLKPVHRRVLFGMFDESNTPDKPHKKSARIVGAVLGKFHPHGDTAVYDSMVRMAQDFSLRYPLVDGHGNFGSIDGDNAAAMRYTEVRMGLIAAEMLRDINENTVDWQPNYDESLKEPVVLPSRFPNLLVNGADGIAVGMATKMPPHNLKETISAIVALMDNPTITLAQLMKHIKGPDFPTSGLIIGTDGIKEYFETGFGKLTLRAKAHIEDNRGKTSIIVTELPYQLAKNKLIERIAALVKDKTAKGKQDLQNIIDIRDESDKKTGIRLVIELKKDANPSKVMALLFKETPLQQTFSVNNLCLVDNVPRTLNLRDMIQEYIKFQIEVIVRRTEFRLEKIKARLHILEGYIIALDPANIDEVIAIIKKSADAAAARSGLMKRFKLSEIQAQAVLDLRLQKLTKMDIKDIKQEYAEKKAIKAELEAILKSETKQKDIIKQDLLAISQKFGDERRTEIIGVANGEVEDLEQLLTQVPDEEVLVILTNQGYIKRVNMESIKINSKGTRGNTIMEVGAKDFVQASVTGGTNQEIWIFGNDCNVYMSMLHEIIDQNKTGRGRPVKSIMGDSYAKVSTVAAVDSKDKDNKDLSLLTISEKGFIKRTAMEEYITNRSSILGFQCKDKDRIIGALVVASSDNVILTSDNGNSIHFAISEIPMQGRKSAGVIGMKLETGGKVVGYGAYPANNTSGHDLLVITENGFAKSTVLDEYPMTKKGGKGVKSASLDVGAHGKLAATCIINNSEMKQTTILVASANGNIVRLKGNDVVRIGRAAKVVKFITPAPGDKVTTASTNLL